jgi:hypothetical protein
MMPDHLAKPDEPVQSGRKYAKVCCYSVMPVCSEQLKMASEKKTVSVQKTKASELMTTSALKKKTVSALKKTVCSEQLKKNCGSVMNGLLKKMMICWYLYCG